MAIRRFYYDVPNTSYIYTYGDDGRRRHATHLECGDEDVVNVSDHDADVAAEHLAMAEFVLDKWGERGGCEGGWTAEKLVDAYLKSKE